MATDYPDLLTVTEVAAILRIHRNTLYKWVHEGTISSVTVGKTIRFRRVDIERIVGEPVP